MNRNSKIVFLCLVQLFFVSQLHAQNAIEVTAKEAAQIISSKNYESLEPIEINLDSVGTKIIRTFFNDKANYPDRISKKQYLDWRYYYTYFNGSRERLTKTIKFLKNQETRKRIYTLVEGDSLLLYLQQKTERSGFWRFSTMDTTIARNTYYQLYTFEIATTSGRVADCFVYNHGWPIPWSYTGFRLIYQPHFVVGIPKVNLLYKNGTRVELPLILLGRDFISYPSNHLLLENVLKVSGYSNSQSDSLMLYIDYQSTFQWYNYFPKELKSVFCKGGNSYRARACYEFLHGRYKYNATLEKPGGIHYALVEEPENLKPAVLFSFERQYFEKAKLLELNFKAKRGRNFIFEIEAQTIEWPYKKEKYKAIYNDGQITFRLVKKNR